MPEKTPRQARHDGRAGDGGGETEQLADGVMIAHGGQQRGELQAEQHERGAVEPEEQQPQTAKVLCRVSTSVRTGSRQPA